MVYVVEHDSSMVFCLLRLQLVTLPSCCYDFLFSLLILCHWMDPILDHLVFAPLHPFLEGGGGGAGY